MENAEDFENEHDSWSDDLAEIGARDEGAFAVTEEYSGGEHPLTLLVHHPACELHNVPDHPERPARTRVILQALRARFPTAPPPDPPVEPPQAGAVPDPPAAGCSSGAGESNRGDGGRAVPLPPSPSRPPPGTVLQEALAPLVSTEQLCLFHDSAHVARIFALCEKAEAAFSGAGAGGVAAAAGARHRAGPNTAALAKARARRALVRIDADTAITPFSREAMLRAAGAACFAVDEVMSGRHANAFCCVRPPGHHAEPSTAMGFCFFNSAAVAALHARRRWGAERVAVIDFDVHHGNGTETLFHKLPYAFYASTHQGPDFYPGTGYESVRGVAGNIVNCHLRSGAGSGAFRAAFSEKILPALREFAPGIVVISAGFDAHRDDPLAGIQLEAEDFYWATRELCLLASEICDGRVVSVLEGGYNLQAIADSAAAHVRALVEAAAWEGERGAADRVVAAAAAAVDVAERAARLQETLAGSGDGNDACGRGGSFLVDATAKAKVRTPGEAMETATETAATETVAAAAEPTAEVPVPAVAEEPAPAAAEEPATAVTGAEPAAAASLWAVFAAAAREAPENGLAATTAAMEGVEETKVGHAATAGGAI